ncbi:glycosyltransferase family 2 protein [Leptothoe spongobia]|uniref:Glycosyltransferase family 2 protein n=1 Tax=Leptothoe spongobia TAU-MAC 1115 TaxID=1967444 RepID=A0A947DGR6_9CYAN|nr:glycosyltransferase family 2 protein [Leptothoe spongobia]MBT9316763.1 glycosyltransferase family 2 protein [Leptothoe spongobia TAU-MAC 1115]
MDLSPLISIIIVNYNGADVILDCLRSIYERCSSVTFEVIVIDNASSDGSLGQIHQEFPQVSLLTQDTNLGFGKANNIGVRYAQGEFLFFLNSDTLIPTDILLSLLTKLTQSSDVGIVGPRLLNTDGSFQLSVSKEISILGEFQTLQQVRRYRDQATRKSLSQLYSHDQFVDIVVGAAMFMRRSLFQQVGGFDETFFMYLEESDLCKRVRDLGYTILYTSDISLIHIGGYSVAKASETMAKEYRRSQRYYYKKHRPVWEQWLLAAYLSCKSWYTNYAR